MLRFVSLKPTPAAVQHVIDALESSTSAICGGRWTVLWCDAVMAKEMRLEARPEDDIAQIVERNQWL